MKTEKSSPIPCGARVAYHFYGEPHTGRVIRDNGTGIVWIECDKGGPLFREQWMHRESLTVLTLPAE